MRHFFNINIRHNSCFNPRTREGCDIFFLTCSSCSSCFNPRTREGCDHLGISGQLRIYQVSIHAPARGATGANMYVRGIMTGFQSTHPRGVRRRSQTLNLQSEWFQSTHPRGVRHLDGWTFEKIAVFQSTHPRGVRPDSWAKCTLTLATFQSTHPRGVRLSVLYRSMIEATFQSTHPRGVRQGTKSGHLEQSLFQSTHPRGVRLGRVTGEIGG